MLFIHLTRNQYEFIFSVFHMATSFFANSNLTPPLARFTRDNTFCFLKPLIYNYLQPKITVCYLSVLLNQIFQ